VLLEYCINWEIVTPYIGAAGILYQLGDYYSICRCCWNIVSTGRLLLHMQVLLEYCINWDIVTPYVGAAGILYQLGDFYSICRCCWNAAKYEWKVHNDKIEIISFVVKFRSEIRSHGEYSYYGSGFSTFGIFPNHNYC
jgi:hypothetical protein